MGALFRVFLLQTARWARGLWFECYVPRPDHCFPLLSQKVVADDTQGELL